MSLVESALSMVVVSVMLVAALNAVGSATKARQQTGDSARGRLLAQDLMAEILMQEYEEPKVPGSFGREPGESGSKRVNYNDVDDYDGWSGKPPERKDGTAIPGVDDWTRNVTVDRVDLADVITPLGLDKGLKLITVSSVKNKVTVSTVTAIKSRGLPSPTESLIKALMVVANPNNLTVPESDRKALLESWGYAVSTIRAIATQAAFDDAVSGHDVAYIPVDIIAGDLGKKLTAAPIGVVNANPPLLVNLGFASGVAFYVNLSVADVVDNTHFITSTFATGTLTLSTSNQWYAQVTSGLVGGAQVLATIGSNKSSLFVFERGALLVGGTSAPARRVQLPWGKAGFDFNALTPDGQTILQRALAWAADKEAVLSAGPVCGDGTCDANEDACTCADDCGPPDAFERVGVTCADGLDNDCDGPVDCADANCATDPSCLILSFCGDGTCDPGEDCNTCGVDCAGLTTGKTSDRYCCGNGTLEAAEGDGTICDGNP